MNKVRFGIIGMGNIGVVHADTLLAGKVARGELVAVVSSSPAKREAWAGRGMQVFSTAAELFQSRAVDAVIIATPHWQHPELGIAAFKAGVHVLMEKPIAAHKADAERLISAYQKTNSVLHSPADHSPAHAGKGQGNDRQRNSKLVFGCMYQKRAEPCFQKIRALVQSGELGEIVRVNWIITDWFRTEAYYASGGWRATWAGEGGGVLLNQCLHNLDLLQWILGMPKSLRGFCQFGRFHKIEVEDSVTAYLEWMKGANGVFVSSTGEAPGTNRFEIAGTKGRLVLEHDRLTFTRNEADMLEFSRTATQGFVKPATHTEDIAFAKVELPHAMVVQNFVNAVLGGEPLIAPGTEGIHALELANAITLSSLQKKTLPLPMSGAVWQRKLNQLARR